MSWEQSAIEEEENCYFKMEIATMALSILSQML
jgi:hypothetical protein